MATINTNKLYNDIRGDSIVFINRDNLLLKLTDCSRDMGKLEQTNEGIETKKRGGGMHRKGRFFGEARFSVITNKRRGLVWKH